MVAMHGIGQDAQSFSAVTGTTWTPSGLVNAAGDSPHRTHRNSGFIQPLDSAWSASLLRLLAPSSDLFRRVLTSRSPINWE